MRYLGTYFSVQVTQLRLSKVTGKEYLSLPD